MKKKPNGFYKNMSNENLLEEARKYNVNTISELMRKSSVLCNLLRERKTSDGVRLMDIVFPLEERICTPHGFYKNMTDEELIKESRKYDAKSPTELVKKASGLHKALYSRKTSEGIRLIEIVFPIGERNRKPNGFYKNMSDEELISEARKTGAKSPIEIQLMGGGLYFSLIKRKNSRGIRLIEVVFPIDERGQNPKGFYKKMSNNELIDRARKYEVKSPKELEKCDPTLYANLNKRKTPEGIGLMEIIFPEKRTVRNYSDFTLENFIVEVKNLDAKGRHDLEKKDQGLYIYASKQDGWLDFVFGKRKDTANYTGWTIQNFINAVVELKIKDRSELRKKHKSLYQKGRSQKGWLDAAFGVKLPLNYSSNNVEGFVKFVSYLGVTSKRDLQKKFKTVYERGREMGWLDVAFPKKIQSIDSILQSYILKNEEDAA